MPVTDPEAVVEAIFAAVTPQTRAIFVSHITSGTALRLPVEEITRRAHDLGLLSIIDGAHAAGQIPVNLHELGADFYAGTFHKWTCAPKGSGFLYAAPQHHGWTEAPIVSWGWVEGREQFRPDDVFISRNQMQGTRDLAAYLAAPSAVEFLESHNWDAVRERCHGLVVDARDRIAALYDLPQICPETTGTMSGSGNWPSFRSLRQPIRSNSRTVFTTSSASRFRSPSSTATRCCAFRYRATTASPTSTRWCQPFSK